jgi:heptaprenyl diphosphate synthase
MNQTRKLTLSAILVSVMLVLGYLESLVPISTVPGIKLGLSNCALLIAVYWLGVRMSFAIMVVKVVLLGLLLGNPMMIVYSLAGGTLSLAVMALLAGRRGISAVGAGIAGGVMHNVGQVLVAMLILQTPSLAYYLGVLMPVGAGMGLLTGTVATTLMRTLPPLANMQKREQKHVEE